MNNKPLVSIITVCYNSEKYIEKTIQSVLNQTYDNIEYIIIDGKSTDNTVDIIKKYENQIDFWKSEEDKGISDAFNKGLRKANGEIIGILNSDDWYEKEAIQTVIDLYSKTGKDFYVGALRYWENDHCFISYPDPRYAEKITYCMPRLNHPASFFKKDVYDEIGLFDTDMDYAMDYDFFLRATESGKKGCLTKEILSNMRLGGASDTDAIKAYFETFKKAPRKMRAFIWFIYSSIKVVIRRIIPLSLVGEVRNIKYR